MGAVAHLKQDAAFFGLFPAGIPIISSEPNEIGAFGTTETGLAYRVDWAALSNDQKIDLAEAHKPGIAHIFLKYMHDGGTLPLPVNDVNAVEETPHAA